VEPVVATENDTSCTLVELHHLTQGYGSLHRNKPHSYMQQAYSVVKEYVCVYVCMECKLVVCMECKLVVCVECKLVVCALIVCVFECVIVCMCVFQSTSILNKKI